MTKMPRAPSRALSRPPKGNLRARGGRGLLHLLPGRRRVVPAEGLGEARSRDTGRLSPPVTACPCVIT